MKKASVCDCSVKDVELHLKHSILYIKFATRNRTTKI
jgi:hypothetical protein